ncbi:MBL fold metallo-hydrolase [Dokdonia sp. Hel_I_53]|uniref:MBL fold metallo-hydrolase n=1 Tax=Dokdonia sp. Hel_I_53 TaxID=1566287 RepID=UPI00119C4883|nr:MBL fold metallo-hydrolase [Dokdonia sp. Hel_I_53]TVZ52229.1 glyoxylase-like metal-dependent hydrolase (beta-lactamase superfamily II) [Dokdonia sp. Hel_I_53]
MKYLFLISAILLTSIISAQGRFDAIEITTERVTDHIFMLKGAGGNIAISTGKDGVFMIDDQFAPLSNKIMAAISNVSDLPVKFLINTHFHGDHSGGNANFESSGAIIIAHDNVRERLSNNDDTSEAGLPIITFSKDATFYQNGDDIFLTHVHNAHTDGDALVYFAQSNVLHTGDTFFNGRFPYIDLASGGSITGAIVAAKKGLMLINDTTKIIPGHGDLATKGDYQKYHDMLEAVSDTISKAISNGQTEDQVAADKSLTEAYFTDKETKNDFISGEKFRRTVYKSLNESLKKS